MLDNFYYSNKYFKYYLSRKNDIRRGKIYLHKDLHAVPTYSRIAIYQKNKTSNQAHKVNLC